MTNTTPINNLYPVANGLASSSPFVWIFLARDPTSNDVNYPTQKVWLNTTTNVLWFLKNFSTSNGIVSANWVVIENGAITTEQFIVQTGTSPVIPNGSSQITFNGAVVPAGTNPVRTDGTGPNTMALEVQTSQAIASTDSTKIGLAAFNSADFTVDANGFVSAAGAVTLQFTGTTGTATPSSGNINIFGASTAAGTSPVSTTAFGSTVTVDVQKTQAIASTNASNVGLAAFNSANFTVDANGFVSAVAAKTSALNIQTFTSNGTYTPTSGMVNCIIEIVGGGGGGGGVANAGASSGNSAGGGGSGAYSRSVFSAASIGASQTVTIGAGGTAGTNVGGNGGVGGTTSVGILITAGGGLGGVGSTGAGDIGGNGGTAGTGQVAVNGNSGGAGTVSVAAGVASVGGGFGANSYFGPGGKATSATTSLPGNAGANGGGGSGACSYNAGGAQAGAAGGAGYVLITEFLLI